MRQESADYEVFPKIVEAGRKTAIGIRPLGQHAEFDERTDYRITVIPMCDSREGSDLAYDTILCRADSGSMFCLFARGAIRTDRLCSLEKS